VQRASDGACVQQTVIKRAHIALSKFTAGPLYQAGFFSQDNLRLQRLQSALRIRRNRSEKLRCFRLRSNRPDLGFRLILIKISIKCNGRCASALGSLKFTATRKFADPLVMWTNILVQKVRDGQLHLHWKASRLQHAYESNALFLHEISTPVKPCFFIMCGFSYFRAEVMWIFFWKKQSERCIWNKFNFCWVRVEEFKSRTTTIVIKTVSRCFS